MAKHRAVVIGAGRIGAGYNWHDDAYTHAGAYRALSDRVELVGFVEPDLERRIKANMKWNVPTYETLEVGLEALKPDIVSVCVQPHQQQAVFDALPQEVAVYCEKPYVSKTEIEFVQVNYIRRADVLHQVLRHLDLRQAKLTVWAKDDIHTKCHFDDLAEFWGIQNTEYNVIGGGCSYQLEVGERTIKFNNGGCDGGVCMSRMLRNLVDSIEGRDTLWSSR